MKPWTMGRRRRDATRRIRAKLFGPSPRILAMLIFCFSLFSATQSDEIQTYEMSPAARESLPLLQSSQYPIQKILPIDNTDPIRPWEVVYPLDAAAKLRANMLASIGRILLLRLDEESRIAFERIYEAFRTRYVPAYDYISLVPIIQGNVLRQQLYSVFRLIFDTGLTSPTDLSPGIDEKILNSLAMDQIRSFEVPLTFGDAVSTVLTALAKGWIEPDLKIVAALMLDLANFDLTNPEIPDTVKYVAEYMGQSSKPNDPIFQYLNGDQMSGADQPVKVVLERILASGSSSPILRESVRLLLKNFHEIENRVEFHRWNTAHLSDDVLPDFHPQSIVAIAEYFQKNFNRVIDRPFDLPSYTRELQALGSLIAQKQREEDPHGAIDEVNVEQALEYLEAFRSPCLSEKLRAAAEMLGPYLNDKLPWNYAFGDTRSDGNPYELLVNAMINFRNIKIHDKLVRVLDNFIHHAQSGGTRGKRSIVDEDRIIFQRGDTLAVELAKLSNVFQAKKFSPLLTSFAKPNPLDYSGPGFNMFVHTKPRALLIDLLTKASEKAAVESDKELCKALEASKAVLDEPTLVNTYSSEEFQDILKILPAIDIDPRSSPMKLLFRVENLSKHISPGFSLAGLKTPVQHIALILSTILLKPIHKRLEESIGFALANLEGPQLPTRTFTREDFIYLVNRLLRRDKELGKVLSRALSYPIEKLARNREILPVVEKAEEILEEKTSHGIELLNKKPIFIATPEQKKQFLLQLAEDRSDAKLSEASRLALQEIDRGVNSSMIRAIKDSEILEASSLLPNEPRFYPLKMLLTPPWVMDIPPEDFQYAEYPGREQILRIILSGTKQRPEVIENPGPMSAISAAEDSLLNWKRDAKRLGEIVSIVKYTLYDPVKKLLRPQNLNKLGLNFVFDPRQTPRQLLLDLLHDLMLDPKISADSLVLQVLDGSRQDLSNFGSDSDLLWVLDDAGIPYDSNLAPVRLFLHTKASTGRLGPLINQLNCDEDRYDELLRLLSTDKHVQGDQGLLKSVEELKRIYPRFENPLDVTETDVMDIIDALPKEIVARYSAVQILFTPDTIKELAPYHEIIESPRPVMTLLLRLGQISMVLRNQMLAGELFEFYKALGDHLYQPVISGYHLRPLLRELHHAQQINVDYITQIIDAKLLSVLFPEGLDGCENIRDDIELLNDILNEVLEQRVVDTGVEFQKHVSSLQRDLVIITGGKNRGTKLPSHQEVKEMLEFIPKSTEFEAIRYLIGTKEAFYLVPQAFGCNKSLAPLKKLMKLLDLLEKHSDIDDHLHESILALNAHLLSNYFFISEDNVRTLLDAIEGLSVDQDLVPLRLFLTVENLMAYLPSDINIERFESPEEALGVVLQILRENEELKMNKSLQDSIAAAIEAVRKSLPPGKRKPNRKEKEKISLKPMKYDLRFILNLHVMLVKALPKSSSSASIPTFKAKVLHELKNLVPDQLGPNKEIDKTIWKVSPLNDSSAADGTDLEPPVVAIKKNVADIDFHLIKRFLTVGKLVRILPGNFCIGNDMDLKESLVLLVRTVFYSLGSTEKRAIVAFGKLLRELKKPSSPMIKMKASIKPAELESLIAEVPFAKCKDIGPLDQDLREDGVLNMLPVKLNLTMFRTWKLKLSVILENVRQHSDFTWLEKSVETAEKRVEEMQDVPKLSDRDIRQILTSLGLKSVDIKAVNLSNLIPIAKFFDTIYDPLIHGRGFDHLAHTTRGTFLEALPEHLLANPDVQQDIKRHVKILINHVRLDGPGAESVDVNEDTIPENGLFHNEWYPDHPQADSLSTLHFTPEYWPRTRDYVTDIHPQFRSGRRPRNRWQKGSPADTANGIKTASLEKDGFALETSVNRILNLEAEDQSNSVENRNGFIDDPAELDSATDEWPLDLVEKRKTLEDSVKRSSAFDEVENDSRMILRSNRRKIFKREAGNFTPSRFSDETPFDQESATFSPDKVLVDVEARINEAKFDRRAFEEVTYITEEEAAKLGGKKHDPIRPLTIDPADLPAEIDSEYEMIPHTLSKSLDKVDLVSRKLFIRNYTDADIVGERRELSDDISRESHKNLRHENKTVKKDLSQITGQHPMRDDSQTGTTVAKNNIVDSLPAPEALTLHKSEPLETITRKDPELESKQLNFGNETTTAWKHHESSRQSNQITVDSKPIFEQDRAIPEHITSNDHSVKEITDDPSSGDSAIKEERLSHVKDLPSIKMEAVTDSGGRHEAEKDVISRWVSLGDDYLGIPIVAKARVMPDGIFHQPFPKIETMYGDSFRKKRSME